jgi:hypothetical protein
MSYQLNTHDIQVRKQQEWHSYMKSEYATAKQVVCGTKT